jgi:hypothetical protein
MKMGTTHTTYFRPTGSTGTAPLPANTRSEGGTITGVGSQFTLSEAHPEWRHRKKNSGSLQDIGGNFFTQKKYIEGTPAMVSIRGEEVLETSSRGRYNTYIGNAWAVNPNTVAFPPANNSSDSALNARGATAIARCKPTNSIANLATTFGEFLHPGGIPKAQVQTWRRRTEHAKSAGSDYLNLQFGWAPLVDEMFSFARGVLDADLLLDQYERDAGKLVRRTFEFPTDTSGGGTSIVTGSPNQIFYQPYNTRLMNRDLSLTDASKLFRQRTVSKRAWFSGAFCYYLPRGYDSRNEVHRKALLAKQVLGLYPTPETIWNVAPWSWAVDWFSNAGDVMSNVSSFIFDGAVMPYGYIMEHSIVRDTYTRQRADQFYDGQVAHSSMSFVTETKIRRKASPYGFGVSWDGLSTFQASILAALGITRKK